MAWSVGQLRRAWGVRLVHLFRKDAGAGSSISAATAPMTAADVDITIVDEAIVDAGLVADTAVLSLHDPAPIYAANRSRVEAELQRLRAMGDEMTDRDVARADVLDVIVRDGRQVLFFDPSDDGRIAVVSGDLLMAANVAVTVPGISNCLDNFGRLMDEGERLHRCAVDAAVVTWLGYDAPVGICFDLADMRDQIGDDDLARVGATNLANFVSMLRTVRPGVHLSVIGHSYGSLVTGLAARDGLDVNAVVFIGSPGVGASSVDEFRLPSGAKVYAASTGAADERKDFSFEVGRVRVSLDTAALFDDPVTDLGEKLAPFGVVPTDPAFGAVVVDIGPGVSVWESHTQYYDEDSPSLAFLAAVVEGRAPA